MPLASLKDHRQQIALPANETPGGTDVEHVHQSYGRLRRGLYSAVEIVVARKMVDAVSVLESQSEVDAERGFRINGEMLKLKGGAYTTTTALLARRPLTARRSAAWN
jgi:hypothetical protein